MRLMEMAAAYVALLDAVEVETGGSEAEVLLPSYGEVVTQDAFLAALYAIEDTLEGKVDGYCSVVQELERSALELRDIERRYASRRQALERRAEQVRERLGEGLIAAQKEKVKTLRFSVSLMAEGKELIIENPDLVPELFIKPVPPPPRRMDLIDRAMLKRSLSGNATPAPASVIGAFLRGTGKRSVRILIGTPKSSTT